MDNVTTDHHLTHFEDCEPYVGPACVERVLKKAEKLHGFHVAHVNSTCSGGGVAEMLSSLTLLMDSVGIKTVARRFLRSRLLEQYLDLFASFETRYRLRPTAAVRKAQEGRCQ